MNIGLKPASAVLFCLTASMVQAQDFSGTYAGLHLGYADGTYEQASQTGTGVDVDVDGVVGGLTLGRNWQNGATVYGIEADISNGPDGITPQGESGDFWFCGSGDCNASVEALGQMAVALRDLG